MRKIAAIGECMVELASDATGRDVRMTGFAGDTCNSAVYLRRLLDTQFEVSYVTSIGTDRLSTQMLAFLSDEGINTDLVHRNGQRTVGIYLIENDLKGDRRFIYWRDRSAARTLLDAETQFDLSPLLACELILVSAILPAVMPAAARERFLEFLGAYRAAGGCIAFDSNYRPQLWESVAVARAFVARMHSIADIALPSLDDELALFGDADEAAAIARLRSYGARQLVIKRGARGPFLVSGLVSEVNAEPTIRDDNVAVIDATGAGDAFNAGYLAARICGESMSAAALAGHRLAVRVIGQRGAILPRV